MLPYFNCPFIYNGSRMHVVPMPTPPVMQPVPIVPMPPIMPPPQTLPPVATPMPTPLPEQPAPPVMQPMPPMMPICPMPPMMPICPMPNFPMMPYTEMDGMEDMDMDNVMMTTSDPPPVLSNNPPSTHTTLFKELTGYPNYGNPSGNADILYTRTRGTWTFDVPPYLFVPGNQTAQIRISAVLDDHSNVPVNRYSARITINGNVVHNGPVPLEHGVPAGSRFNNWRTLVFNVSNWRRNTRVTIVNTSTAAGENDWIGLDWMELRIFPR